jgi:hypothetical protein
MTFTIIRVGTDVLERTFLRSDPEPSQTFFCGCRPFHGVHGNIDPTHNSYFVDFGCPEPKNHPLERGRTAKREALKFWETIICGDQSYLVDCIVQ